MSLDFLRSTQNADGGWGFFPGKQSWLEPTAYALMALHSDSSSANNFERGWNLMRSWQLPGGGWQPCAAVRRPQWTTALCITLHCLRGVHDEGLRRGVAWLLDTSGIENRWQYRLAHLVSPSVVELDPSYKAWPWLPGCSSWIEPTAHALVALKKAAQAIPEAQVSERIRMGERMILDRRCSDGGWNYGNRKILGTDLPSYPETTALALLGLSGNRELDLKASLALALRQFRETRSPLARAWLAVSLRNHGLPLPPLPGNQLTSPDTMIHALDAIAANGALA
jgi:Prenyltransferase and squalene oxidase repeat.